MIFQKKNLVNYVFYALLISLLANFLITPFFQGEIEQNIANMLIVLSLIFSVGIFRTHNFHFYIAGTLALPMIISTFFPLSQGCYYYAFITFCTLLFFIYILTMILYKVFTARTVTTNILVGSICAYLIMVTIWALCYSLLTVYDPYSFLNNGAILIYSHMSDFIYFSLVTLTTLGYGDLIPISQPAKAFASIEALIGQLYLTILVARLIGLHLRKSM